MGTTETYPPTQIMTLREWEMLYPPGERDRPSYRLRCDKCGFEHAGTVGAQQHPPWTLVTWTCLSCENPEWATALFEKQAAMRREDVEKVIAEPPMYFFTNDEMEEMYRESEGRDE